MSEALWQDLCVKKGLTSHPIRCYNCFSFDVLKILLFYLLAALNIHLNWRDGACNSCSLVVLPEWNGGGVCTRTAPTMSHYKVINDSSEGHKAWFRIQTCNPKRKSCPTIPPSFDCNLRSLLVNRVPNDHTHFVTKCKDGRCSYCNRESAFGLCVGFIALDAEMVSSVALPCVKQKN